MRYRLIIFALMLLMFSGVCVLDFEVSQSKPDAAVDARMSSIYALAGEFRTVFANLLWIKADHYHHEFIQHNPDWVQNDELVGLVNLIVMLDPQFIEAYANGAYIYADGHEDPEQALAFLTKGIANNPQCRELHQIAAVMYAARLDQPEKALPHAKLAVRYSEDEWYRSRAQRLLSTVEEEVEERQAQHSN